MASTPASSTSQKPPRILSCALCQRRKIRCDRIIPCSNCVKANVTCTPSKPAPPRQRSKPRQDLQDRLARCENLLRQYADRPEPGLGASPKAPVGSAASSVAPVGGQLKPHVSARTPTDAHSPAGTPGRIALDTGPARFIDGQLWQCLNDEIQVMREIIDAEEPEGSIFNPSEDSHEAFDSNFASHCPSPTSDETASLDAVQTFKLWQIFLERVNPLIKIIHAPTIQPYIVQAAGDMSSIPLSYQGLLNSIFGVASMSLSDDELLQTLGLTRERATQKFLSMIFRPLARFDFLKRYDMVVVQALVHALIILNTNNNRHAAWVMMGSLVRIAISMGYHRDGEFLNLPPFETEMRRRIWWQIVTYDTKLTMACGFKHSGIPTDFDTKPPLNLNDADLFPDASGELQSREGPTEMGFVLVMHRIIRHFLIEEARVTAESNILGQTPVSDSPMDPQSLERNILLVQTLEHDLMEIERRFISAAAGYAHAAALGIRPNLIARLRESLMPMQEQPEWGTEIFGPRDNLFKVMLGNFENITDALACMEPWGFGWFIKMHFQTEALASLSSLLYQRPTGSLSDRCWAAFEKCYAQRPEMLNLSQRSNVFQAQFTLKAFDMREKAFAAAGHIIDVPPFIAQLRQSLQPAGTSTAPASSSMAMDTETPMSHPSLIFSPGGQFHTPGPDEPLLAWNFWEGMAENGAFGNGQSFPGRPF